MSIRARALIVSFLLPLALLACNRSEELGRLPDAAAGSPADDASFDGLPRGVLCTSSAQCVTGFCENGVCCNAACTGSCMACNVPSSIGFCAKVDTCSQPLGSACTIAADCASGFCVAGVCCNTACAGSSTACNMAGSVGTCMATSSGTPQANGTVCSQASQCTSGFCVGGVCCDTACTGTCMSCNVTGAVGTCSPSPTCP